MPKSPREKTARARKESQTNLAAKSTKYHLTDPLKVADALFAISLLPDDRMLAEHFIKSG